jgi:putative transposase
VITARELRSINRRRNKSLAEIQRKQAAKVKYSRAYKRLQRAKNKLRAKCKRQIRDIEHKVTRTAADWTKDRGVTNIAYGDVRNIADGKRLHTKSQQKISQWAHGRVRYYYTYKVATYGIVVDLENERGTTKTCPSCKHTYKPRGRVYRCPACGLVAPRDEVGVVNILSRRLYGELGHIQPTGKVKYRQPFHKERPSARPNPPGTVSVVPRTRGKLLPQPTA